MMSTSKAAIALAAVVWFGGTALADNFAEPVWADAPLAVWAEWQHDQQQLPAGSPFDVYALNWGDGGPETNESISTTPSMPGGAPPWPVVRLEQLSDFTQLPEGWQSTKDAALHFNVNNWVDDKPMKKLRIQFTYRDPLDTGKSPYVELIEILDPALPGGSGNGSVDPGNPNPVHVQSTNPVGYVYEDWVAFPNPDWEIIKVIVPQGVVLQQTYINTISPEPASLSLLAIGGLVALRRRRA